MTTGTDVSLITKINRLEGLIDTSDVTQWENNFLSDVVPKAQERAQMGQVMGLTPNQLKVVNDLFSKHFSA